ncbi:MAG: type II toxin-antitoxin system Phd/YefM family antitoxin [Anaerolineae bacterium]
MPRVVTSTELQKNTRDVIDWARTRGDTILVETYGKPMVVILDVGEYEDLLRIKHEHLRERFDRAVGDVRGATRGLPPEAVSRLVDKTRQSVHAEQLSHA